ncbi:MAG: hypothetical protein J6038_02960, partial [Bacilli bacterium]|nr:hypothetical protein [Bacilli bacterium]
VTKAEYLADPAKYADYATQLSAEKIEALSDTGSVAFIQSSGVNTFFTFAFVGLEAITGLVLAGLLIFLTVEKTIEKKHAKIRERQKAAYLARGEEWVEPEVKAELEEQQMIAEAREIFLEELKAKCEKNPAISFDEEVRKYDEKAEAARIKRENGKKAAAEKEAAQKAKAEAKLQAKLAKMSPEQLKAREEKLAKKAAKDEANWEKERIAGETFYEKMQAELNR